ncbi:MAG: hypothetical protein NTW96_27155 [Planctomycetia bacterium]|nr:hypothetical protein [Planctomycetia bacterium]
MFVACSCKRRCTCPFGHQKRALLTAIPVAEEVCSPVAHWPVVLTIFRRLRLHTRFDRKLLGKCCWCACTCIQTECQRLLGRDDLVPGMVAEIQTHGDGQRRASLGSRSKSSVFSESRETTNFWGR